GHHPPGRPPVPLRPRRAGGDPRGPRALEPLAPDRQHDRRGARPLPEHLHRLSRRRRQGGWPAGGEEPAAACLRLRARRPLSARAHLPRDHDGLGEDAPPRGAALPRRALEGRQLRHEHPPRRSPHAMKVRALGLAAIGLLAAIAGLVVAPARTWPNLLVDGFYFLCLGGGAMFFLATQR